jgi:hypothetical protein
MKFAIIRILIVFLGMQGSLHAQKEARLLEHFETMGL